MSVNNVVVEEGSTQPFVLATDERMLWASSTSRQSLTISSKAAFAGTKITCDNGRVYVTNKRFVFITGTQGDINSFSIDVNLAPLIQFSHELKSPWFGANYWKFMFFAAKEPAIANDGFPKEMWYEGAVYFNDGGLFDFIPHINRSLTDATSNRDIDDELPQYTE
ncbi:hypothetical protein DICA3_F29998 [Diutina catenulata]